MITVLKPSQLKADAGKILDKAIKRPQYVNRNGVLLVITKAELVLGTADDLSELVADTWNKLGPAPEVDYDKL